MLFGLIGSLIRLATTVVLLPLRMLSRHFVGTLILFAVIYLAWPKGHQTQPTASPVTRPAVQRDAQGKALPRIDPVTKEQDGNSRFSDDLLSQMNQTELRYYSNVLYWTLANQPDGKPYTWNYFNIEGTITPYSAFQNSFGHQCRTFDEILKVHETRQTSRGLACQRVEGGWCRLRYDSTPLCDIGEKDNIFQGIGQKLQSIF